MGKHEELERAIAYLEEERAVLGDDAADAALDGLRRELAALNRAERQASVVADEGLGGERRLVSILFADIAGFTAMSEQMDPEAVRDLVNACFKEFVPIIERYGGTVARFMGDSILALFGAPVAHENDAERACRAALDIMDSVGALKAELDIDLGLHLGINTGLVVAGALGTHERQEYTVTGDAANLAARLESAAGRGDIFVGPDTYRLTTHLFDFETLKPVELKGKSKPVQAYRLVGVKPKARQARWLQSAGIGSSLVGRDAELATVLERLRETAAGQGGILTVVGEAGLGKSRLMAEARKKSAGVRWLEGRALSFGQTISYWPFQGILWQWAGITEENSEGEAWDTLERHVWALFGTDTVEVLPYLVSLLGMDVKGRYAERVEHLSGEAMGHQVYLTARRFFERLAREQPLVLVFEDLHWVDRSSAELLEHLLPLVERAPLLICGVSRPESETPAARLDEVAARDYPEGYTEIRLAPLTETESAWLVGNLLEIDNLPPRVRALIVRKAEGNPFFVEEIIRSLIDARVVVRDEASGRWQATVQVEAIAIPDTIQGVIMSRVDRLDEGLKDVLRTAAVIGRSFFYRALRAIGEADGDLDEHLETLQAIELIRKKQAAPELEYIFKHALAQEATYESILLEKRRELHARVGQVIESLFADRLEEFYGLLAYHYARAETWEKAQEYLLKAGDRAGQIAADAEAIAYYEQAMAGYERAFGERWDPLERAALERKIGEALYRRGRHEEAIDHLQRGLSALDRPLPVSRWAWPLAVVQEAAVQAAHRLILARFLPSFRPTISPKVREEIRINLSLGWIDVFFGNSERYVLIALRSLNLSERAGFAHGVASGCSGVGMLFDYLYVFNVAEGYHRRAIEIAKGVSEPGPLATAFLGAAAHRAFQGEWEAALELGRQAADSYRATGNLHEWGYALYILIYSRTYMADFSAALADCRDLIHFGREGGDPDVQCWGLAGEGFVLQRVGDLDHSLASLLAARALADAIPDRGYCMSIRADLARCYVRRGALDEALSACKDYVESVGGDSYASLRNGLAEAYLCVAERGGSQHAGYFQKAGQVCKDALKHGKAFRPGLPEAMRLQGTYEWLRGRLGAARKWWGRSLDLAEKMGQRYNLGMTHLEMGRRLGERAHLERAEAIFAEVGAEWDEAQAREALSVL